jgi:hypothetical protein
MKLETNLLAATALLGSLGISSVSSAACTGGSLNQTQLAALLTGNTVCAVRGSERWQELHLAGGSVVDFKRGPADPVDPSETVGTWSIIGTGTNATVQYNYGSGGTYTYTVFSNGGTSYSFCAGATDLVVTVKAGGGACP